MSKKCVILTQVIMTVLMGTTMSGVTSLIVVGPLMEWLAGRPRQLLVA